MVDISTLQRAAEWAGALEHEYKKKGVTLSLTEVVLAALAVSEGHALVTDNVKHFPMPS